MVAVDPSSLRAVKAAIAAGELRALSARIDAQNEAHADVLLALTSEERRALLAREHLVSVLGQVAHRWALSGRTLDALVIFDDAILARRHVDLSLYANALWTVMDDNHHLGVMRARANEYVVRCLPFASQNPAIAYNAACVSFELGDTEIAIECVYDAIRFGYGNLDAIRNEPLLAPLRRRDARFEHAFTREDLRAEWNARRLPTAPAASRVDWSTVFDRAYPKPGATEAELTVLRDLWTPLSIADEGWLTEPGALERAQGWTLEGSLPPTSYLDFLRFSNGGTFESGRRLFRPFFEAHSLRGILLGYGIPETMSRVLPFAFDGGGVFYAFDMREPAIEGQFPVIAFHASTPVWEEASLVAVSFEAACRGLTGI